MSEYLKRNRSSGKCPVDHEAMAKQSTGCPMEHEAINPNNMMPLTPRQLPHPDQDFDLPTDRVTSTIPKGKGTEGENWVYPSPQMFYNAVRRKGGDADEDSMKTVVSIHNRVNEYCWGKIKQWESLRGNNEPKLSSFRGRYNDLSPKARFCMAMGYV